MTFIKKLAVLLVMNVVASCNLIAQNQVHLSVSYLPKHQYNQKIDQVIHLDIKLPGGKKGATRTESANMKTPTKTIATTHNESITTTGSLTNDTSFPVQMTLTRSVGANGQSVIPPGTIVYGNASLSGGMVFDSIVADGLDEKKKEKFFTIMKSLASQVVIPEHTMKVGEKFTHQTPLTMPVSGIKLDMVINTTYKLRSISNGFAYFDLVQEFSMKGEGMSATFKVGGTGKGSMIYDIENRYYTRYELDATLNMEMKMEGETMSMKMETSSNQSVDITAN